MAESGKLYKQIHSLCLIRHGETVYNIDDRMQGRKDIELTPRGLEEAKQLGALLKEAGIRPERVHSSPVKRALDTAAALGMDVPVLTNSAFSARSLGELEDRTKSEIRLSHPGALENLLHWDWVPPGATESLRTIFNRAEAEIEILLGRERKPLTIVTHSGVLEALIRGWYSLGPQDPLPVALKNACALLFDRRETKWEFTRGLFAGKNDASDFS